DVAQRHAANKEERHVAVGWKEHVVGQGCESCADGDCFLSPAYVNSAEDLALAIQPAFDALFDFAHQRHVMKKAAGELGLRLLSDRGLQCYNLGSGHLYRSKPTSISTFPSAWRNRSLTVAAG